HPAPILAARHPPPTTPARPDPEMITLLVLLALAGAGILVYNGLVRLSVQADNAWADIDVQLKRRHELIPNLVEVVRGYASHDRDTLEAVLDARARAIAAQGPAGKAAAETELADSLRSLFALAEAYPQLRAVEGFNQLHASLERIEDAIQNARRYYNAVVRDHNIRIAQFPSNIVARAARFRPRAVFEAEADERAVPRVEL